MQNNVSYIIRDIRIFLIVNERKLLVHVRVLIRHFPSFCTHTDTNLRPFQHANIVVQLRTTIFGT